MRRLMRDLGIVLLCIIVLTILFRAYVEGAYWLLEAARAYATGP